MGSVGLSEMPEEGMGTPSRVGQWGAPCWPACGAPLGTWAHPMPQPLTPAPGQGVGASWARQGRSPAPWCGGPVAACCGVQKPGGLERCPPHLPAGWRLLPVFLPGQAGRSPVPSPRQPRVTLVRAEGPELKVAVAQTARERTHASWIGKAAASASARPAARLLRRPDCTGQEPALLLTEQQ